MGLHMLRRPAARKAASSSRPDMNRSNEALLCADSPFEDLTENAMDGDKESMRLALKA